MKQFAKKVGTLCVLLMCLTACGAAEYRATEPQTEPLPTVQTENPTEPEPETIPETESVPETVTTPPEMAEITFSGEFVKKDNMMPYALFTPSTAETEDPIPLIVWLHGVGERNLITRVFMEHGMPGIMNNWSLEGFNAYVLCPQLIGKWGYKAWNYTAARDSLQAVLDDFISEYNVDTDRIFLMGHSLGAQGAMFMAQQMPEYFSKLVVLSGYHPAVDFDEIEIPTLGYIGTVKAGEEADSVKFMKYSFAPVFGEENVFVYECSHINLPGAVLNDDKDGNNRSDIIEWLLEPDYVIQSDQ